MTNRKDVLVEVGTEEIPARMMPEALGGLKNRANNWLNENRLKGSFEVLGTPRRLIFNGSVSPAQDAWTESKKGPPVDVAYENDEPTQALKGFCDQHNATIDQVKHRKQNGGEYTFLEIAEGGLPVDELLEGSFSEVITSYTWPKNMRWDESGVFFVRPIRWVVAFCENQELEITLGSVKSGTITRGLRHTDYSRFEVSGTEDYRRTLSEKAGILYDQSDRRQFIRDRAEDLAKEVDGRLVYDENLLDEVTHLVEAPTPFIGSFDRRYLELPDPVLIESMQDHQKYFPVTSEDGLLPYFIGVRNGSERNLETVVAGNEKVLRARLNDAEFFYEKDRKLPYEEYRSQLKGVVFQQRLGSLFQKTERLSWVVSQFAGDEEALQTIARHCKNDSVTEMVEEFPGLQGTIGKIYAEESGWSASDAKLIEEHYRPRDRSDSPPEQPRAQLLSLVDKADTVVGFFALGERPTGSSDPYGLRRDVLAIIRLFMEEDILRDVIGDLSRLLDTVQGAYKDKNLDFDRDYRSDLENFFRERLRNFARSDASYFKEADSDEGHYQALRATLPVLWQRPKEAERRYYWISADWMENKSDPLAEIIEAYKRIDNILSDEKIPVDNVDTDLFESKSEETLWTELIEREESLEAALEENNSQVIFEQLHALVKPINELFEDVLINAENEEIRRNRHRLLGRIRNYFDGFADFSQL